MSALTPEQVSQAASRAANEGYLHNVLDQFDRLWSAILGNPQDTTISEELAVHRNDLLARVLAKALDLIQAHHVELAAIGDETHAQKAEQIAKDDIAAAAKVGI